MAKIVDVFWKVGRGGKRLEPKFYDGGYNRKGLKSPPPKIRGGDFARIFYNAAGEEERRIDIPVETTFPPDIMFTYKGFKYQMDHQTATTTVYDPKSIYGINVTFHPWIEYGDNDRLPSEYRYQFVLQYFKIAELKDVLDIILIRPEAREAMEKGFVKYQKIAFEKARAQKSRPQTAQTTKLPFDPMNIVSQLSGALQSALGVFGITTAKTKEDIAPMVRTEFKRLAVLNHPDKNPDGMTKMQELNAARDVLKSQNLAQSRRL